MPIYEFGCKKCGYVFEKTQGMNDPQPLCPKCGGETRRLISPVAFKMASDTALKRVEKRFNDYVRWGKYKDAVRFAKKASEYIKHDKIKKMQERVERKLEQSR